MGSAPVVFVWDACTGEKLQRIKLNKGARGVNAIGFNSDATMVAAADLHNDHNVYIWKVSDGGLVHKDKGDTNKIYDLCWDTSNNVFCTGGAKHIKFWWAD